MAISTTNSNFFLDLFLPAKYSKLFKCYDFPKHHIKLDSGEE